MKDESEKSFSAFSVQASKAVSGQWESRSGSYSSFILHPFSEEEAIAGLDEGGGASVSSSGS
jgi:hypothetical protein